MGVRIVDGTAVRDRHLTCPPASSDQNERDSLGVTASVTGQRCWHRGPRARWRGIGDVSYTVSTTGLPGRRVRSESILTFATEELKFVNQTGVDVPKVRTTFHPPAPTYCLCHPAPCIQEQADPTLHYCSVLSQDGTHVRISKFYCTQTKWTLQFADWSAFCRAHRRLAHRCGECFDPEEETPTWVVRDTSTTRSRRNWHMRSAMLSECTVSHFIQADDGFTATQTVRLCLLCPCRACANQTPHCRPDTGSRLHGHATPSNSHRGVHP